MIFPSARLVRPTASRKQYKGQALFQTDPATEMVFTKGFALILLSLNLASVLAVPVSDTQALSKRGSVLTGQWDTESEVRMSLNILAINAEQTSLHIGWRGVYSGKQPLGGIGCYQRFSKLSSHVRERDHDSLAHDLQLDWWKLSSQKLSVLSFVQTACAHSSPTDANLDLRQGLGKTISSISSIPTTWHWTYSSASSGLVADVSYDIWLSDTAGTGGASSSSTYEIMIWLSTRGGAGPAGSQIGTATVDGVTWNLYKGTVSTWTVFSFVAPSEITSFDTDLKPFLTYLTSDQGVSSSQYLVQAQAGTEPFIGIATLTTTSYQLAIN
ncbi:hypothetical protein EW146_g1227 [Bondarzewia mesenterica]|uniref:Uncharacterized protein n=1 Tax=Bondarzewia mesenterica TaxID=1095465 RepID=A0A4S4M4J7_9AGAM|nr:hypothetical protein EW146_g1227 [Bondarzewia mesenterica]